MKDPLQALGSNGRKLIISIETQLRVLPWQTEEQQVVLQHLETIQRRRGYGVKEVLHFEIHTVSVTHCVIATGVRGNCKGFNMPVSEKKKKKKNLTAHLDKLLLISTKNEYLVAQKVTAIEGSWL